MEKSYGLVADTLRVHEALPDTTPKRARNNGREALQLAEHPGVYVAKVTEIPNAENWQEDGYENSRGSVTNAENVDTGATAEIQLHFRTEEVDYGNVGFVSVVGQWREELSQQSVHRRL